jgi:hypothetical protein
MYLPANSEGRYRWNLVNSITHRVVPIKNITPMSHIRGYYFTPEKANIFDASSDSAWQLQLQEVGAEEQLTRLFSINIPRRPKPITVSQMPATYPINGTTYHLPDALHKYAMLRIYDADYVSLHRTPYQIVDANDTENIIATIHSPGASAYADLTQRQKDSLQTEFNIYFNKYYNNNRAARIAFAKTQQGLILGDNVTRIVMPDNGAFFLYTKQINATTHRLYKATLSGKQIIKTEALIPNESVTGVEVTPDGSYAVYKRYNTAGLYKLYLNGTIPYSGTKITDSSLASTDLYSDIPNHIYSNSSGGYSVVTPNPVKRKIYHLKLS